MDFNADDFKLHANGGLTALGLGAWYLMEKYLQKQNKDQLAQIFKLMEDDIKYKELLTGILTRLEVKLDYASKEREK